MGIYEVATELEAAIKANLKTQIQAVDTAKSIPLDSQFTIYSRERAETFHTKRLPGVGVYIRSATTGAKRSGTLRDWNAIAVVDYFVRGRDRDTIAKQVELTLDAMMRVVDKLAGTGTIAGAGELPFNTSIFHDVDELIQEAAASGGPFLGGFRMEIPIRQRDTGL